MTTIIFDKTDKARAEIAQRSNQLASRLRTLLVLIDGKTPAPDLLKKVSGLGLDAGSLEALERDGYITPVVREIGPSEAETETGAPETEKNPRSDLQQQSHAPLSGEARSEAKDSANASTESPLPDSLKRS